MHSFDCSLKTQGSAWRGHIVAFSILFCAAILTSFDWGYWARYVLALGGILGLVSLFDRGASHSPLVYKWVVLLLGVHVASAISSLFFVPFNWSWFFQVILFCLIIIYVNSITPVLLDLRDRGFFSLFFQIFLGIAVFQLFWAGFYEVKQSFISALSSTELISSTRSVFSTASEELFGITKEQLGANLAFLLLLSWSKLRRSVRVFSLLFIPIYIVSVNIRVVIIGLIGCLVLLTLLRPSSARIRLYCFLVVFVAVIVFIIVNIASIEDILNANGRFIVPIFKSIDFWSKPFGVGYGNYYASIKAGCWDSVYVNEEYAVMVRALQSGFEKALVDGLYPLAESNLVLIAVSFGVIGTMLYALFFIYIQLRAIVTWSVMGECHRTGYTVLMFLFIAGLFQDYFSLHFIWLVTAFAISFFFYGVGGGQVQGI